MTIKAKDYRSLKICKKRIKKIGKKSIHDIIYNTPDLSFSEKIDFIRHHYTYYEGNYPMFHDENGKPNELKKHLNSLIIAVLLKKKDPKELKRFNKYILKWRKKNLEKEQNKQQNLLNSVNPINTDDYDKSAALPKYAKQTNYNCSSGKAYLKLIDYYLRSPENIYTEEQVASMSYSFLRDKALQWVKILDKERVLKVLQNLDENNIRKRIYNLNIYLMEDNNK